MREKTGKMSVLRPAKLCNLINEEAKILHKKQFIVLLFHICGIILKNDS